jgi:hypothetical protein
MSTSKRTTGRGVSLGTTVAIGAFVAGMWLLGCHEGLTRAERRADRAWSAVERVLLQRAELGVDLLVRVSAVSAEARAVGEAVMEARLQLRDGPHPQRAAMANLELQRAVGRLLVIAEGHPSLRGSESMERLRRAFAFADGRLALEAWRYEKACRRYNAALESFPVRLEALGFTPRAAFDQALPLGSPDGSKAMPAARLADR